MTGQDETTVVVHALAMQAKGASRVIALASTETKRSVLRAAADGLRGRHRAAILEANARDLVSAEAAALSPALIDRLRLDLPRLEALANAVDAVARQADPVGETEEARTLDNGLQISRMRVPLGVIAIIYESRPNVTADAAALCIQSGNACILRGGSEAFETSRAIARAFHDALRTHGLPPEVVTLLPTTDRAATLALLREDALVDLVIPRGGEGLIRFVAESSRIPVIRHYKGVCHVYVDAEADLEIALNIVLNAKTQRPGVCNALETLLVDRACMLAFVPKMTDAMQQAGVKLVGDPVARSLDARIGPATEADWDTEYLDLKLSVAIVEGLGGALAHIEAHGTQHSECIVTRNSEKAERFLREVDASFVAVNASTRFNDGGELGLGAEIGISTTKLHAYGPMGLRELTARKWIARGQGHVRR